MTRTRTAGKFYAILGHEPIKSKAEDVHQNVRPENSPCDNMTFLKTYENEHHQSLS